MGFGVTGFLIFKVAAGITGVRCITCWTLSSLAWRCESYPESLLCSLGIECVLLCLQMRMSRTQVSCMTHFACSCWPCDSRLVHSFSNLFFVLQSSPTQRAMHTDTNVRPWLEQALGCMHCTLQLAGHSMWI